jgi:MFS family permease
VEKTVVVAKRPGINLVAPIRTAFLSLQNPHFRVYWFTNALFFIGQGLVLLGAQWLMLSLTDSRSLLGALGAIQGAVILFLSPFGGVMADRLPRRNILIAARATFAVLMTTLGLLVITDAIEIWHLLLSVAASGLIMAFSQAATQSYVFDLVGKERLMNALALNSIGTGIFQMAGPSIGGPILDVVGPEGTYLLGASGYFVGAVLLVLIPVIGKTLAPPRKFSVVQDTLRDIADGASYIRRDSLLPWLFLVTSMTFFGGAIFTMRPVFAKEILDVGARGLGWMGTAFGGGALFGAVLVAGIGDRLKLKGLAVLLAQLNWMVAMVIYSQSHWFPLNLVAEGMMGLSTPFWSASAITILQVRVPEALRNRVLTVHFMIITGISINWWVTGQLADIVGDREALLIMGAIPTAVLLFMLLFIRQVVWLGSQRYPLEAPPATAAASTAPTS